MLRKVILDRRAILSLLYYISLVGYLALYDIFALTLPGNVIVSPFDAIFLVVFVLFLGELLIGDLSLPIWQQGANRAVLLYLVVLVGFPLAGYLFHKHSIGVLTSPIRKVQLFLFLPITASFIYDDVISIRDIYIILLGVTLLHLTTGAVRLLEIDETVFSFHFESLLSAATIDENPSRTAGLFGAIPWFGSLMAVLFLFGIAGFYHEDIPLKMIIPLLIFPPLGIGLAISRTALIMIGPGLAILVWKAVRKDLRFVPLSGILLVGIIIINRITGGGTLSRFSEMKHLLTGDLGEISALAARMQNWQTVIAVYEEVAPFGTLVSHNYIIDLAVDNTYLTALLQSGVIGVGTILLLYIALITCGISEATRKGPSFGSCLVTLVTISFAIGGLTMSILGFIPTVITFWVAIGIAIGSHQKGRVEIRVSKRKPSSNHSRKF